jgi:hypothetical protein
MTQVMVTESALLAEPTLIHSTVLQFVESAIAEHGTPVKRALLEWYADTARVEDLPDSITVEQFAAFQSVLGECPRRRQLLSVLRDLVEMHCLEQSIDGFAFTDKGKGLLLDFKN